MQSWADRLSDLAKQVVRVFGCAISLLLALGALFYTQYMLPGGAEYAYNMRDSIFWNLVSAAAAIVLFMAVAQLERVMSPRVFQILTWVVLACVMLWMEAAGLWWICSADRVPEGDQAFLYGGASYFLEGNYEFLAPLGYFGMYPYQLGLTALIEMLFSVVGTYNYFAVQFICVQLVVGIVWLGYRIVRSMSQRTGTALTYCVLIAGCLPLVFYSGWVYGDIPSVFFILLATLMLVQYDRKGGAWRLAVMVFAAVMAYLVRSNSLIFLVALCLVTAVALLKKRDKKLLLAVLFAVLLPFLAQSTVYLFYERISGYEHVEGVPYTAAVTMGLQEKDRMCGWDNNYQKEVIYACGGDYDRAAQIYKRDLKERLAYMGSNPKYAAVFFAKKILSQWNQPLFQSVFFNHRPDPAGEASGKGLEYLLCDENYMGLLAFADRLQFVIYLGMIFYFFMAVNKERDIDSLLPAVTIIGGFLFSVIWEAKARYSFPYYILMFPIAVVGYERVINLFREKIFHCK